MTAITFLRVKGVLSVDCKKWKVKFKGGPEFDMIDLMEEYARIKMEEVSPLELVDIKECSSDVCTDPETCSKLLKCKNS